MYKDGLELDYTWYIHILVQGRLDGWMKELFANSVVLNTEEGSTHINTELPDISAVYGLILQLRDFGINLISLNVSKKYKNN